MRVPVKAVKNEVSDLIELLGIVMMWGGAFGLLMIVLMGVEAVKGVVNSWL